MFTVGQTREKPHDKSDLLPQSWKGCVIFQRTHTSLWTLSIRAADVEASKTAQHVQKKNIHKRLLSRDFKERKSIRQSWGLNASDSKWSLVRVRTFKLFLETSNFRINRWHFLNLFFGRLGREVRVESPWSYSSKLEFPTQPPLIWHFPENSGRGERGQAMQDILTGCEDGWTAAGSRREMWGEDWAERSDRPVWVCEDVKSTWSGGLWRLVISWKWGKSSYCRAVAAEVFGRFSGSRWRLCTCLQL